MVYLPSCLMYRSRTSTTQLTWKTVVFILCVFVTDVVFCQARYSIPEEMPEGSFVGDIAKDLGIEISRLISGKARVVTKGGRQYVDLSRDKGTLVVKERIDREELCKQTTPCSFSFDLIIENPIQLHRVIVEVQDTNDNAPKFPKDIVNLHISENTASGTRFHLDSAVDMDVGMNGIQSYALSPTEHFKLEVSNQANGNKYVEMVLQHELDREQRNELKLVLIAHDGGSPKKSGTVRIHISVLDVNDNAPVCKHADDPDVGVNALQKYILSSNDFFIVNQHARPGGLKYVEMVLQKPLDREQHPRLAFTLTAVDGGTPQRSGNVKIEVTVLDVNDNAPVFNQTVYRATIAENSPRGTYITTVKASDADSETNGLVSYSLANIKSTIVDIFKLDEKTGVVTLSGMVDYEKTRQFEFDIEAKDQGGLGDSAKVTVELIDVNDNAPTISVMSFSNPVNENVSLGTTIAVFSIRDLDAGDNGLVICTVNPHITFKLQSSLRNYYTLATDAVLDRESVAEYNITITATDSGSPGLSNKVILNLKLSNVNDNPPRFLKNVYTTNVIENNSPGLSIFTLSAHDADSNQNARISYFLEDKTVAGSPVASYVSVNADSGVVYAVRSFDYEQMKNVRISVRAQDGGSPRLSTNVILDIIIQDQNDNAPQVLYPVQTGGSLVAEIVPRSADVGYLVTKVVAVDVDSGQNAWLSYKLQKATDRALFEVGPQNGEIRTVRQVTDKDAVKQKLTVVVEDNGQPSRSAVVYINVAVADSFPEVLSEFNFTHEKQYNDNLTFYLVLALAAVSFLFITCLLVIISVKIYRWRQSHSGVTGTLPHMYNYDVCMTNDSRKSDCKYSTLGGQNVLLVDPSFTKTTQNTPKGKFFLEDKDSSESSHLILRFYPKFRLVYIPTVSCLPCGLVFTMCIKVSTFLRILLDVRNVVIIVAYCFSASLLSFSLNFCFILSLALASCLAT
uniref:Cadherin domain-containing protein n=1 Tax=Electrophorus electricus TaxID=8005 RepID=A0AAY5E9W9_ELEEL